ncbi:MAG: hypothetical protein R3315_01470 [Woeseiaceae bacterium]|nr:hypothetical protein [Woeseiaceae bacterium]
MKGLNGQSIHELVGLAVLALMVIALIGAQAGATAPATAAPALPAVTAALPERPAVTDRLQMAVRIDEVGIDLDFESLAILFAIGDAATRLHGEVKIVVNRDD